jgi:uncharacterized protein YjdB
MVEYGNTLYIVTAHEGYVDPAYNQGHQGFLMIAVDKATMTGSIVSSDLWHSFAQYIAQKDGNLYVLEQSEGSRYTSLAQYDPTTMDSTTIPVLEYGGSRTSAWAIACYASVDAIAVSSSHVLGLGTSIDQSNYDSVTENTPHNIYVTVTPQANFTQEATKVKWLTNYSGGGKAFLGTKITKVNDNRFMVSWEEYGTSQAVSIEDGLSSSVLHYVFLDGQGNKISKEFTAAAPISDCQPIVNGSKIVYYASNASMVNFYSIDAQSGAFSKKLYRVAGEKATWSVKDNVLVVSGTGALSIDTEAHFRYPISSTGSWYTNYSGDNAWKPIREHVKKIVIENGVSSVPDSAFVFYDNLVEVEISPGVKSIGKLAFYSCNALEKITIPASVTSIGEDFLWTGYTWISGGGHVVRATIYAPKDSYAASYAKKNNIAYVAIKDVAKKISVTGVKTLTTLYLEKGKAVTLPAAVQPSNATDKTFTWKTGNKKVVSVNTKTGKIKALKKGSTTLTVTTKDGKKTAKVKVVVVTKTTKLKTLKAFKPVGLTVGKTVQIKPKVSPTNATRVIPTYKSSKKSVVTVDAAGVIKALKKGTTVITVKAAGKTQKFTVTVGSVLPKKITLNKKSLSIKAKSTFALKVKWSPTKASPKTVKWTTSNKRVATVSSKGVVKGVKKGRAVITATTWNGKTVKCAVTVR